MKTKGQLEAEISEAIISFEKEYMGRGPTETRSYIIEDLILVRLKGVLTPAEHKLAETASDPRGRSLIKDVRLELVEQGRALLETKLAAIVNAKVISLHTDISTRTGERIIVFSMSDIITYRSPDS